MSRVLALDTDVLAHWLMADAPHQQAVRRFLKREIEKNGRLGLAPQVLHEFLHVVSDPRRFENPMPMVEALRSSLKVWNARDVERILPTPRVFPRTCELMAEFKLGRKRVLDTALAATLELAGVRRLATLNGRDFRIFPFLEIVDPTL